MKTDEEIIGKYKKMHDNWKYPFDEFWFRQGLLEGQEREALEWLNELMPKQLEVSLKAERKRILEAVKLTLQLYPHKQREELIISHLDKKEEVGDE